MALPLSFWESSTLLLCTDEGFVDVSLGVLVYGLRALGAGSHCCGMDGSWLCPGIGVAAGTI